MKYIFKLTMEIANMTNHSYGRITKKCIKENNISLFSIYFLDREKGVLNRLFKERNLVCLCYFLWFIFFFQTLLSNEKYSSCYSLKNWSLILFLLGCQFVRKTYRLTTKQTEIGLLPRKSGP